MCWTERDAGVSDGRHLGTGALIVVLIMFMLMPDSHPRVFGDPFKSFILLAVNP